MALTAGQMVAHYKVIDKIGEGGMGEVYRAEDTRLKRQVALKLLPEVFVSDQERMSRFAREAQVLASLNHTHIGSIYGIEQDEQTHCLVLELIGGQTLAERIQKGPLPLAEAVDLAHQIAEGLEAAHEGGIVHRDLKPANIKVTGEGVVKILDFGLAKALVGDAASPESSMSPTLTTPATHQGVILGTAAYMSPEQAKGLQADRRADIWAFGVILHEMLTGRRLFGSNNVSETLAAVLMREPDEAELPPSLPPAIRQLIRRCLHKDPRGRLQAIGEARILLDNFDSQGEVAAPASGDTPVAGERAGHAWLPWALAGGLSVAFAVVLWLLWPAMPAADAARYHVVVPTPEGARLALRNAMPAILSPGGHHMAFAAWDSSSRNLWYRSLDQKNAVRLGGTERAEAPFFSPDGQWLGFFADRSLKKVSVSGGAPQSLVDVDLHRGGSWSRDGKIVYAPDIQSGLWIIDDAGGEARPLTETGPTERSHRWPFFMPDGRHVLFITQHEGKPYDAGHLEAVNIETGERTVLHRGGTNPRYAPTGHLLYGREGTLFALPLDAETMTTRGTPMPVMENIVTKVGSYTGDGAAFFHISAAGHLAAISGDMAPSDHAIHWLQGDGQATEVVGKMQRYAAPRLSPDQTRFALSISTDNGGDLWVFDLEREVPTRLTFDDNLTDSLVPSWTPDGRSITYFTTHPSGGTSIMQVPADGSGQPESIHQDSRTLVPISYSPEGHLALHVNNEGTSWDVEVMRYEDGAWQPPAAFLEMESAQTFPEFSPDGRWIAYASNQSGRNHVYIRPYPGPGGQWQVSNRSGHSPRWVRGGSALVFRDQRDWFVVDVEAEGDVLRVGRVEPFLQGDDYRELRPWPSYDISPDGSRLLVLKPGDQVKGPAQDRVELILNWASILPSRAGGSER